MLLPQCSLSFTAFHNRGDVVRALPVMFHHRNLQAPAFKIFCCTVVASLILLMFSFVRSFVRSRAFCWYCPPKFSTNETAKFRCMCGADNCRGTLAPKSREEEVKEDVRLVHDREIVFSFVSLISAYVLSCRILYLIAFPGSSLTWHNIPLPFSGRIYVLLPPFKF